MVLERGSDDPCEESYGRLKLGGSLPPKPGTQDPRFDTLGSPDHPLKKTPCTLGPENGSKMDFWGSGIIGF